MAVDFEVDEKTLQQFVQLQKKGTNPADSIFTISLPDGFAYPISGEISLIDRAINPQTGTIKVRLVFPNKDLTLRPGMTCNARVKNSDAKQNQILVPYKAVTEQMGEYFVYIVGDSSKAVQKKVVLGRRIDQYTIVKSGLEGNETVITDGIQRLKEGMKVSTMSHADSAKMKSGGKSPESGNAQNAAGGDSAKK